jgi:hypothetical protein
MECGCRQLLSFPLWSVGVLSFPLGVGVLSFLLSFRPQLPMVCGCPQLPPVPAQPAIQCCSRNAQPAALEMQPMADHGRTE